MIGKKHEDKIFQKARNKIELRRRTRKAWPPFLMPCRLLGDIRKNYKIIKMGGASDGIGKY